ncbi:sodium/potassium/calcium exchanger 1-like isoform X1 [Takifugu flavidus]|uniref:sodium/potassium/calcium exchanger 1-like isoform X1 n=1 Tax=Takifugu flavidus TaxID=433684 RepID=UPI002544C0EE|nr:sodium/potassium/calcium exchanger 1-like isoform X1 [Takifugu flavidus]XP_056870707.1 sodium/potassium/calcium exchanger 1-like isoform X1 [Takifugu flavidus]
MNVHSPQRRRLGHGRVLLFISGVLLCVIYTLTLKGRLPLLRVSSQMEDAPEGGEGVLEVNIRDLMSSKEMEVVSPEDTEPPSVIIVNRTDIEQCIYVEPKPAPTVPPPTVSTAAPHPPHQTPHRKGDYPEDLFSLEQRQQGWVFLHIVGMIYMFVALAIVCDEFFVPGLEVITNKLEISDDVAGATFMAAGGSAPELFTSLIGVFISHSNVGIGTIVGSAVFNILFVIGMCAISSREVLHLTWWPLFRDVTFYIVGLIMLIVFFLDNVILWWESVLLVLAYVSYVSFMKFNSQLEQAVKSQLNKHVSIVKVWTAEEPEKDSEAAPAPPPPPPAPPPPAAAPKTEDQPRVEPEPSASSPQHNKPPPEPQEDRTRLRVRPALQRGGSSASLHNTSLRNTIFQLMIHTLDPLGEEVSISGSLKGPAPRKNNGAKNQVKPLNDPITGKLQPASHRRRSGDVDQKPETEESAVGGAAAQPSTSQPQKPDETAEGSSQPSKADAQGSESSSEDDSAEEQSSSGTEEEDEDGKEEEGENEPLSLEWPETRRRQATYLLLLPIIFPLWLTLPDVRNTASRKYFALTFIGSIMWIGVFSYLMVWWAHQVGETVGISEEIMGLTILAAGTSIPDLITSVIVARKGLGDMAVSSSVGSNIFDITVGLPVPWLLFILLHKGEPVTVSSNGLFCAIVLLFLMLLFVIASIAACRWRMSRMLGFTMFVLYFVFLVLSVLLEVRALICPVSI